MGGWGSGKGRQERVVTIERAWLAVDLRRPLRILHGRREHDLHSTQAVQASTEVKVEFDLRREAGLVRVTFGDHRFETPFGLVSRDMPRGGLKWFARCPACLRPCLILYMPTTASAEVACRLCHGLAYRSQMLPEHRRLAQTARRIRRLLGGSTDLLTPLPDRPPPGMSEVRFRRLKDLAEAAERAYLSRLGGDCTALVTWGANRGLM